MKCQKDLFSLHPDSVYLNGAYMSPMLQSVEDAGIKAMIKKRNPNEYTLVDFFDGVADLKKLFAQLINAQPNQIAIAPSTSYGLANVANNIKANGRQKIIVADEQFPSNYYVWSKYARDNDGTVQVILPDETAVGRATSWNQNIIKAIDDNTVLVALSHVHWADGTLFDLAAISQKCKLHGARLIIDGTQSTGIYPFDFDAIGADALISAGYKCLMGPYGMAYCCFSEEFYHGDPIEDSWINRRDSDNFARLVDYKEEYREGAYRYDVGQSSSFIHVAMAKAAISQLLEWGAEHMQEYCRDITQDGVARLRAEGFWIEDDAHRAAHLFGIRPPSHISMDAIKETLTVEKISVSYRGSALRVSPNVYNTQSDIDRLTDSLLSLT